jgi:hypothetical protein
MAGNDRDVNKWPQIDNLHILHLFLTFLLFSQIQIMYELAPECFEFIFVLILFGI